VRPAGRILAIKKSSDTIGNFFLNASLLILYLIHWVHQLTQQRKQVLSTWGYVRCRTRDLLTCSALPEPSALPRALFLIGGYIKERKTAAWQYVWKGLTKMSELLFPPVQSSGSILYIERYLISWGSSGFDVDTGGSGAGWADTEPTSHVRNKRDDSRQWTKCITRVIATT